MVKLLLSKYKSVIVIEKGVKKYAVFMKERYHSPLWIGVLNEYQPFWKKTAIHYRWFVSEGL